MFPLRSFCPTTTFKKKERKLEMVQINFTHFALGIMVLLLALKDCEAYINRGIKKVVTEVGDRVTVSARNEMHYEKEIFVPVPGDIEEISDILGGRKMMLKTRALSNEVKKDESKKTNKEVSKMSGASSVGNSNRTRKLKMRSKLSSRSINQQLKVKMGGFMSLNADYHMAKTHPPRNN